ncbi:MAG: Crp/Fnr family transcriptional regulator [Deltaproteobacteria bacterium]
MSSPDPLFARFGREFLAGAEVFREGDSGKTMYVIQTGKVRITKDLPTGSRVLAILGPGDFFGEMAILNDKPRTGTADVLEDSRMLVLDAKTFEAMVVGNAEIAVRLVKKLARRLDGANSLIEILLEQDPRVRVILGLSRIAEEFGTKHPEGVHIPTTTVDLAAQIGLDEGQVIDVMNRLVRLRILHAVPEGGWVVHDPNRLQEFLEFLEMRDKFGEP